MFCSSFREISIFRFTQFFCILPYPIPYVFTCNVYISLELLIFFISQVVYKNAAACGYVVISDNPGSSKLTPACHAVYVP